jgi:rod shape determining protein RodA
MSPATTPRSSRSIDWPTVLLYLVLVGLGWVAVYAASYVPGSPEAPARPLGTLSFSELMAFNWFKQLLWMGTSIILIGVLLVVDYKAYDTLAYALYGGMVALLVLTIFIARPIAGSRSWLELGPVRLQPAEFAKFTTALAASRFMAGINLRQQNWRASRCCRWCSSWLPTKRGRRWCTGRCCWLFFGKACRRSFCF